MSREANLKLNFYINRCTTTQNITLMGNFIYFVLINIVGNKHTYPKMKVSRRMEVQIVVAFST